MPIHKTCAFSKAPIEEDKEIVMVYLSSETIKFNNAEIKVPFSSSDYTYAWDNFKIIGFPIMGTFISHSKVEYECLDSEKMLLSVINAGSVTQYSSLNDLNQDVIRNDFKAIDKSKNKSVTSFMILRSVFELLISEKREREMVEGLFMIPEEHEKSTISYSESLIENEYNLSNLKTKNILLLNDDVEDEKDSYDTEKEKLRMLRYILKNHFSRNLVFTGKSLFDIALETPEKASLIGKHLTNLYWVAFSFDRYRMPLVPTLHSYENRNHFEIASLYRKLANLIEKESTNPDTEVPFYQLEKPQEYIIKEHELLKYLEDFDDEYAKEIIELYQSYKVDDLNYKMETALMTEDENELLFDGDLFNSQLSGNIIIIKKK